MEVQCNFEKRKHGLQKTTLTEFFDVNLHKAYRDESLSVDDMGRFHAMKGDPRGKQSGNFSQF